MTSNGDPGAILRVLKDYYLDLARDIPNISISIRDPRDPGVYEMKIRSRVLGLTFTDTMHLTIRSEGDSVVYESPETGKFRAIFRVSGESGKTRIDAEVFYNPTLRVPFKKAAEKAVEDTLRGFLEKFLQNIDQVASVIALGEMPRSSGGEFVAGGVVVKGEVEKPGVAESRRVVTELQASAIASQAGGVSCRTCLLYEASVGICTYFMKRVEDLDKPLCKGEKYIRVLM